MQLLPLNLLVVDGLLLELLHVVLPLCHFLLVVLVHLQGVLVLLPGLEELHDFQLGEPLFLLVLALPGPEELLPDVLEVLFFL